MSCVFRMLLISMFKFNLMQECEIVLEIARDAENAHEACDWTWVTDRYFTKL